MQQDIPQRIRNVCAAEPAIRLAYLHGSHASGMPDKESDIDIGVLLDSSLNTEERFRMRLDLMGRMAEALRVDSEKVDLIVLQDVPALLKYNVIRKGFCVFERDRSERVLFELRVEQEYDDEIYYLERENEYYLSKFATLL